MSKKAHNRSNLVGKVYGKLTVISYHSTKYRKAHWKCKCKCGNITIVSTNSLNRGHNKSCGKCTKFDDLIGKTFNNLTVIDHIGIIKKNRHWKCRCVCGNITIVYGGHLKNGRVKSCGCDRGDHNLATTSEYRSWYMMIWRCYNEKAKEFKHYGGRGIKVCDRWLNSVDNFVKDIGKKPSNRHSIDRIDNNGDYCPENCRWATKREQASNTRRNHLIEYDGETKTLMEWADLSKVSRNTFKRRIYRGWSIEDALKLKSRELRKK